MSAFSNLAARAERNSQGFVRVRDWGNGTASKTAGTIFSDVVSAASNDLIIVMVAWDYSVGGPTISSVTDTKGTTYTSMGASVDLASSGDGVSTQAYYGIVPSSHITASNTTVSVTFSANVTAKVIQASSFQEALNVQVNTRTTSTGITTGPSAFTTPIAHTGDLVLVFAGWEQALPASFTGATDTTRGTWVVRSDAGTTGSSSASNICLAAQYKIVTGQGSQSGTLTSTTASDWTAQAFVIKAR